MKYPDIDTMMHRIVHPSLNATLQGVVSTVDAIDILQYKMIQYATISARFEQAEPIDNWMGANIDSSRYGYVSLLRAIFLPSQDVESSNSTWPQSSMSAG